MQMLGNIRSALLTAVTWIVVIVNFNFGERMQVVFFLNNILFHPTKLCCCSNNFVKFNKYVEKIVNLSFHNQNFHGYDIMSKCQNQQLSAIDQKSIQLPLSIKK